MNRLGSLYSWPPTDCHVFRIKSINLLPCGVWDDWWLSLPPPVRCSSLFRETRTLDLGLVRCGIFGKESFIIFYRDAQSMAQSPKTVKRCRTVKSPTTLPRFNILKFYVVKVQDAIRCMTSTPPGPLSSTFFYALFKTMCVGNEFWPRRRLFMILADTSHRWNNYSRRNSASKKFQRQCQTKKSLKK